LLTFLLGGYYNYYITKEVLLVKEETTRALEMNSDSNHSSTTPRLYISKEIADKITDLQNRTIALKASIDTILLLKPFIFGAMIVSTVMAFLGFYLWYIKLQKHKDEIIKLEAEKLRSKIQ